ncbi:polysaccharide deacetylase family protein [Gemmatimonadota bacterium]
MQRRDFISSAGATLAAAAAPLGAAPEGEHRVHIVSLSFDDGFAKSFARTAEIYEKFGLSACLNIVASGSDPDTEFSDSYAVRHPIGGWELWNELAGRGHEIMPHGWQHAHLPDLPLSEAQALIKRCLDRFGERLRGFDATKSVFNFPYNQSSPELEAWLPEVVMALRTTGGGINPLPDAKTVKITTEGFGPGNSEEHLDRRLKEFVAGPSGWFVYNLHGLDDEGWGPIRATYLESLLGRLLDQPTVRIVPTGRGILQS